MFILDVEMNIFSMGVYGDQLTFKGSLKQQFETD